MQSGAVMRRSLCPSEPSMRTCSAVCRQVWAAMRPCGHTAGWQHCAGLVQCRGCAGEGTAGLAAGAHSTHTRHHLESGSVDAGDLLRPMGSARGAAIAVLAAQAGQCGQTWATHVNHRP